MKRQESTPGFSRETSEQLRNADTRSRLQAQIHEMYRELNEDPPLGLASSTVQQLQKHKQMVEDKLAAHRRQRTRISV